MGRTFRPEEDQPGHANFVLLSHSLWQRRFGGDPAIAGKTIRLRDQPYTVVGVLPPDFAVLETGVDVFVPLALNPGDARAANSRYLTVIARRARLARPGAGRTRVGGRADGAGAAGAGSGLAARRYSCWARNWWAACGGRCGC